MSVIASTSPDNSGCKSLAETLDNSSYANSLTNSNRNSKWLSNWNEKMKEQNVRFEKLQFKFC